MNMIKPDRTDGIVYGNPIAYRTCGRVYDLGCRFRAWAAVHCGEAGLRHHVIVVHVAVVSRLGDRIHAAGSRQYDVRPGGVRRHLSAITVVVA
jgi:hypothetical protein